MIERRLAKLGFAHDAAVGQPGRIPGSAAVGLLVAAAVLDDFSISATSFILDVVIFAVLQAVLSRLIPRQAVLGAVGLASTFVALLLTNLFTELS